MVGKKSLGSKIFDTANVVFMIIFSITILYPIWDMIVISLSAVEDVTFMSINLFPKEVIWDSYIFILNDADFYNAFIVSVARTVIGTVYQVTICSLCAFALTKTDLPFRKLITYILIVPMFFSGGLIPTYVNIRNLGLLDNFLVYILPYGFSIFNTIVIRNFMLSIDKGLEEAAVVDGANYLRVLFQIILPLSLPILATVSLWAMVGQWNSWFDNLIYVREEGLQTLQYMLRQMMMQTEMLQSEALGFAADVGIGTDFNSVTLRAAITVVVVLPIVMVYPFLQKYFIKGMMAGAMKG